MTTTTRTRKPARKPLSPAKLAKRKAARAAQVAQINTAAEAFDIDDASDTVRRAFDSLVTHYSEGNAVLILAQAAQLGLRVRGLADVGGANAFTERGRDVKDSERYNRNIYIWAPAGTSEDADKTEESATADGRKVRKFFRVVGIYHVSQTVKIEAPAALSSVATAG